jgi:hypothetical protein
MDFTRNNHIAFLHEMPLVVIMHRTRCWDLRPIVHHLRGSPPSEMSVGAGLASPPTTEQESSGLMSSSIRGEG